MDELNKLEKASFHILYNSLFTDHPIIRHSRVFATHYDVKETAEERKYKSMNLEQSSARTFLHITELTELLQVLPPQLPKEVASLSGHARR
jgi:hypothetical protein